jgi:hypothetical protein
MTATDIPYFLPVLLAFIVGVTTFVMIFVKSTSGVKTALSLVCLVALSLMMAVFTLGYLFGPDCVFCTEHGKLRGVVEYLVGVFIFGSFGLTLVWWVGRPEKLES